MQCGCGNSYGSAEQLPEADTPHFGLDHDHNGRILWHLPRLLARYHTLALSIYLDIHHHHH
jgi:hypothetical protein